MRTITFRYHWHANPGSTCPSKQADSQCFPRIIAPTQTDPNLGTTFFIGFAIDGFPIFSVIDWNGNVVADYDNLDECGGKVGSHGLKFLTNPKATLLDKIH